MKLVFNDPNQIKKNLAQGIRMFQAGGTNAAMPATEIPAEQTAEAPGGDIQGMMTSFAQSQDPNIAAQILQTILTDPALTTNVVNILVQQMQGQEGMAPPAEEMPIAKKGMKLDAMTMEDTYSRMNQKREKTLPKNSSKPSNKKGGKAKITATKTNSTKTIKIKK